MIELAPRQRIWLLLLSDYASKIPSQSAADIASELELDPNKVSAYLNKLVKVKQAIRHSKGIKRDRVTFSVNYVCFVPEGISINQVLETMGKEILK